MSGSYEILQNDALHSYKQKKINDKIDAFETNVYEQEQSHST